MSENELSTDEPVESGGLAEPGEGEREPGGERDEPTESGALEEEQRGKGYGLDTGEREESLPDE